MFPSKDKKKEGTLYPSNQKWKVGCYKLYCGNEKCKRHYKVADIKYSESIPICKHCDTTLCNLCRYCKENRLVPYTDKNHPCVLIHGWKCFWIW